MFKDFLTIEGERLLAKSIAGTATITFTKMMIGDGDRGTSTRAITSLESPQMTLDIYSVLLTGDNDIEITTVLESEAIKQGFYFREKGIYATDGNTEILFMYGTSGSLAEWMENVDSAVFTRTIRTIVTLSNSDNVQITLQKGAYASSSDAENILTAIQNIDGDWAKYSQAEIILSILDNFVAAYTTARAGKLDNLDTLVSSRAPASTALSNAVWTNARGALLDNLDAKISSRAPASTALSNATWTNARAGYLDYLNNGTYGLAAIKAYVDTLESNVGNTKDSGGSTTAGTMMAKLNALQAQVDALKGMNGYYKPSANLRYSFVSSEVSVFSTSASLKLGGFYATKSGCIRVTAHIRGSSTTSSVVIFVPKYTTSNSGYAEIVGSPKELLVDFYEIENNTASINFSSINQYNAAAMISRRSLGSSSTSSKTEEDIDTTIWVERGEYVAFYLAATSTVTAYCSSLNVYYDEAY